MPFPGSDECYWPDGSMKWTSPKSVGHLILQLSTLDPTMQVRSVTHVAPGHAKAFGLSMSRERWDENGNLDFKLDAPLSLALWASSDAPSIDDLRSQLTACQQKMSMAQGALKDCFGLLVIAIGTADSSQGSQS